MIPTKPCKICQKPMPKGLMNVCSKKCQSEKEKQKRKRQREVKKVSVSALSKVADTLWSKAIRMEGKCQYCGTSENLNAHHIFGRNNKSVRWMIPNGICLCAGCHTFSSTFSAHKTPTEFTYWLEDVRGRESVECLQILAHTPVKVTAEYLQSKIAELKTIIEIPGKN